MSLTNSSPVSSTMSDDPDLVDLIEEFVANLRNRVRYLEVAYAANDVAELARLAHQLKGASGGYGFGVIGAMAGRLEEAAKLAGSVVDVARELEELVSLCRRASANTPSSSGLARNSRG